MSSRTAEAPVAQRGSVADSAWRLLRAACALADRLDQGGHARVFGEDPNEGLRLLPADDPRGLLAWLPGRGWQARVPADDPRAELLNLYLPICSALVAPWLAPTAGAIPRRFGRVWAGEEAHPVPSRAPRRALR